VLPVGHLAVEQLADDLLAADLLASGYKSARCRANSRTGQCICRHWDSLGKGLIAAAEAAAEAAAVPGPAGQQGERGERGDQGTGILLGIRNRSRRWPSRPLLRIRSTSYGNRSSPSYSPSRRTPEGVEGGLGGGNCSLGYIVIVEGIGVVDSGISVAKSGFSLAEDESTWLSVRKRATLERKGRVVVWMGSKEDYWMLERWEIYSN
jgi:hypothetical protein